MKLPRFTLLAALLTSPSFAQTILIADYLQLQPQNNSGEGGELELLGSGGYGAFRLDNYFGHARIHTLAPGKQFQILGGTIYADGLGGTNFFAGNVGVGNPSPRQKLEVGSGSNPAINIHDFGTAELTLGINEQTNIAQLNTNSNGFRFVTGQDGLNFPGSGTEVVRITSSGNVGIGTQSPDSILAVSQSTSGRAEIQIRNGHTNPSASPSTAISFRGWRDVVPNQENARIESVYSDGGGNNNLSTRGDLRFFTTTMYNELTEKMRITSSGNVGIGTTTPAHKLAVNGTIKAKEVIVETTGWSDYVFADDYRLAPLSEVEAHIKTNKHLPGIPSAAQVAENGVNLGDVQSSLLAKVEELTLHLIAQQKQLTTQQQNMAALQKENQQLQQRLQAIEQR